jgi:CBS domain-containing protein
MVALEHTLVILLLLVGLLNARPKIHPAGWGIVAGALGLALVAPVIPIALPWEWISALLIPVLLWQAARRLVKAKMPVQIRDVLIWVGMSLGIGAILLLASQLTVAGAIMFGILAASMVWRASEEDRQPTHLGQIGPLALAFLLAEIAPAVEAPGRYGVALLVGAGIGAMIGYTAVHAAQKAPQGLWYGFLSIGQAYLAYGVATLFNFSGVAAAMISIAVFVAYGAKRGLWPDGVIRPQPLDSRPVFVLAVLALAFIAWQTHTPLTPIVLLEILLGLLLTVLVIFIGRRIGSEPFLLPDPFLKIMLRVGTLLVPAILLWPREALLDPVPLIIALLTATLATVWTYYTLTPLLSVYAWFDEVGSGVRDPDELAHALLVRELMDRDYLTIAAAMPVPEIARLFIEGKAAGLPVLDEQGRLIGIVTEHDLFVKEERLPRTDMTFQVVFKEPVTPELLHEVYAQKGAAYTAADVMTEKVIWVNESATLGQAVRLMVRYGFKCLPVLDREPEAGGQLVGVITRSGILRLLAKEENAPV